MTPPLQQGCPVEAAIRYGSSWTAGPAFRLNARVLTQQSEAPTLIASTCGAPPEKVAALRRAGIEVINR